jgi:hypothetical protein
VEEAVPSGPNMQGSSMDEFDQYVLYQELKKQAEVRL